MKKNKKKRVRTLTDLMNESLLLFKPVKKLNAAEWAEKYRIIQDGAAIPGRFSLEQTPYMREIMEAASDPKIHRISVVSAAQVGKSELMINIIGYKMHLDPAPIIYMTPTVQMVEDFFAERVDPMISSTPELRRLVPTRKSRDSQNKRLSKKFKGGHLYGVGGNSVTELAGRSAAIILIDEIDRLKRSTGKEGNAVELLMKRARTYPNRLIITVSTPTVKDDSMIVDLFYEGTQERYKTQCPDCHQFSAITFKDLQFDYAPVEINGKRTYQLKENSIRYVCPHCGTIHTEEEMKSQPAKWFADNPEAYEKGHRSFWLKGFNSKFARWAEIISNFLNTKDNPERLKVTVNTDFGELWEDKGSYGVDELGILKRREDYGKNDDGTPVEIPDEVAYLTMAVDTQDSWFEYEVLGYGKDGQTYGIKHGKILGTPTDPSVLEQLRQVIIQPRFGKNRSFSMKPMLTFIDSGGHFSTAIKRFAKDMQLSGVMVYPIKGQGGDYDYISPPSRVPVAEDKKDTVLFINIGVNLGKHKIMNALMVEEPGPRYCHFPLNEEAGYGVDYVTGLISERFEYDDRTGKPTWKPIEGRKRNEPLDIRNYNLAANEMMGLDPVTELEKRNVQPAQKQIKKALKPKKRVITRSIWD